MTKTQILAKLHKTRSTIRKHIARGNAMTCRNGEPNWRSCELVDRYNALKAALIGDHAARDVPQWKSYCDAYGSDLRHDGYDLFA